MSERDAKRKAADAARSLLTDRIAVVETLGAVLYEYNTAKQAVTQAQTRADEIAQRARATFEQARKAGWTAAELRRAGLDVPQPTRPRATKQHSPATPTPPHPTASTDAPTTTR
jgi:predicted nucleic acid-binding protein